MPDLIRTALTPQGGDDYVICHVKNAKTTQFMSTMHLMGFQFLNGYFHVAGDTMHRSIASERWANVRDIYNWMNDTNWQPAAEITHTSGSGMRVVIG